MDRHASLSPARRFATALVASALAHLVLSSAFTSGSTRRLISRVSPRPEPQQLVARLRLPEVDLVNTPSAPQSERLPPRAPKVEEERVVAPAVVGRESKAKQARAGPADIPDPTYYGARQLDVYPALLSELDLQNAASAEVKGHVVVVVLLDATGAVNDVSVVEADPRGVYEESAVRAFRSARFSPAVRDGRPVKSRLMIQVEYGPQVGAAR